ncbi:DNA glycosylase [Mycena belliarum]|uniref:DNA glycosylase n=1 Tax=Mycena belliarum TaxID=1033014 RepID=A0AAD6U0M9_9AGAR|nr:DNA glycosylase [Mycena belliae]
MVESRKRSRSLSTSLRSSGTHSVASPVPTKAASKGNKRRKVEYTHSAPSNSGFFTTSRPTTTEAREVYALLCDAHGTPTAAAPEANVLEGLIATILSQSTSGVNSSRAKSGLDAAFGRNNFSAIAEAPLERIIDAIRCGGLAKKKAATIQKLLSAVNKRHGSYSLQSLAEGPRKTDAEVTTELVSYAGVGPKTAACVLSLCLSREAFAVDTHVWRLSKVLGWVPDTADRVRTQAHLEERLPAELKLGLHALMMRHGRTCTGCKKDGDGACILKTYRGVRDAALE